MSLPQRFKLVFFVPPAALNACKSAIFGAGAGRYPGVGAYTECAFITKGIGQFRPGETANPHVSLCIRTGDIRMISTRDWDPEEARRDVMTVADNVQIGKVGELEEVEEVRVETLCVGREVAAKAVEALKK